MSELIGPAQLFALALLIQRGFEEIHSQRNTRRLLNEGASEAGASYYPVVAVTHLSWIAAVFLLVPVGAKMSVPLLGFFLALQVARYWIIFSLGQYWTHRIISQPAAPIVRNGPYRFLRHPNYLVTFLETILVPAIFGAWAVGLLFGVIWGVVLVYKIKLEDEALDARRACSEIGGGILHRVASTNHRDEFGRRL